MIEDNKENSPIIHIMCDLIGNIFIHSIDRDAKNSNHADPDECHSGHSYYWLTITNDSPELVPLTKNYRRFRKNYVDHIGMKNQIRCGKIVSGKSTLKGIAMKEINKMDDNERTNMDFNNFDDTFVERSYYNVLYNDPQDIDEDDPQDERFDPDGDMFYLNGCDHPNGIQYAPIMMTSPGSFDTILIDGTDNSKNVVSSIERIDGYCVYRMTIYTNGLLKINIIGSIVKSYKLNYHLNILKFTPLTIHE